MTIIQRSNPNGVNHWRPIFWSASVALLVSPLIAMQFTRDVDWDRTDFLSAALLLIATGVGIELASGWSGDLHCGRLRSSGRSFAQS